MKSDSVTPITVLKCEHYVKGRINVLNSRLTWYMNTIIDKGATDTPTFEMFKEIKRSIGRCYRDINMLEDPLVARDIESYYQTMKRMVS